MELSLRCSISDAGKDFFGGFYFKQVLVIVVEVFETSSLARDLKEYVQGSVLHLRFFFFATSEFFRMVFLILRCARVRTAEDRWFD